MRHETYIREVPGARTAVLMVHGILGTPAHFAPLYPQIPADWSVYSILLEGHGGKVEDFAAASMAAWQAQVRGWVEKLRRKYARVVFAAHSIDALCGAHGCLRPGKYRRPVSLECPAAGWREAVCRAQCPEGRSGPRVARRSRRMGNAAGIQHGAGRQPPEVPALDSELYGASAPDAHCARGNRPDRSALPLLPVRA